MHLSALSSSYMYVVISIVSIVLVATAYAPLLRGDHKYSNYFDDKYNFEWFPQLNTLSPFTVEHITSLIAFRGINVHEPVWLVLKAIAYDVGINNAQRLRFLSFGVHICNSFLLLPTWIRLWLKNDDRNDNDDDVTLALISLLFAVHPLNVQVVGWLSAQGYLYALFFALLSGICFELCFQRVRVEKGNHETDNDCDTITTNQVLYSLLSVLCYILACYSKAPALMLAPFHMLQAYLLLMQTRDEASTQQQCKNKNTPMLLIVAYMTGISIAAAVVISQIVFANEGGSGGIVNIGHIDALDGRVMRGLLIIWNFTRRILIPNDLRIHYCPGEAALFDIGKIIHTFTALDPSSSLPFLDECHAAPSITNQLITPSLILFVAAVSLCVLSWVLFSLFFRDDNKRMAVSCCAYMMFWFPCMDIVSHGWHSLGADRYVYLPMALAVAPAAANTLQMYVNNKKTYPSPMVVKYDIENENEYAFVKNGMRHYRIKLISFISILYASTLSWETRRQISSWQNDFTVLNACIAADPTDYECHEYLGQFYGYHFQMNDKATYHFEKALMYIPYTLKDFKSTLFRAYLLLVLQKKEEACGIIEKSFFYAQSLYSDSSSNDSWSGSFQGSKSPIPLIINNYASCQLLHNLTSHQRELMTPLLQKADDIVRREKKSDGRFVYTHDDRTSIATNLKNVMEWQPGMAYDVVFMW